MSVSLYEHRIYNTVRMTSTGQLALATHSGVTNRFSSMKNKTT